MSIARDVFGLAAYDPPAHSITLQGEQRGPAAFRFDQIFACTRLARRLCPSAAFRAKPEISRRPGSKVVETEARRAQPTVGGDSSASLQSIRRFGDGGRRRE